MGGKLLAWVFYQILVLFFTMGITVLYSQVHIVPAFLVSIFEACRFQPQKDEFDHFYAPLIFEVRHPRCVGSITKESLCTTQAV